MMSMESGVIESQSRAHTSWSPKIELRQGDIGLGVIAREPIEAGEVLVALAHAFTSTRAQHTIQIDEGRHQAGTGEVDDYLNHACEPSAALDAERLCFVAARAIAPGEAVTFNYLSAEWDMVAPFTCKCGSPRCFGEIRGFKHLSPDEQARLEPLLTPFLRRMRASLQSAA